MKAKCRACGKQLDTNDAYKVIHKTKKGNKQNRYYCNEEEYENEKREKELYRKCQYETDAIVGFPITNKVRNSELTELHDAGYSWEEIYRCIKSKNEWIKEQIKLKRIESDYQMIRYMMTVIKNTIHDYTIEDRRNNSWEKCVDENIEENFIEEDEEEEIKNRLKQIKENKETNISSFLNKIGK